MIGTRIGTRNPEKHHVFHARILAEMNTIKKKQREPFPTGSKVL